MSLATVLPIAKDLAKRPDGLSGAGLAEAAGFDRGSAAFYLNSFVAAGHLFKGKPEGKRPRWFDTPERAKAYESGGQEQPVTASASRGEVARLAVAHLRKQTLGSRALAQLCKLPVEIVDAALDPLSRAGKLTRLNVLRGGVAEFEYRWGSTWTPCDADFELCRGDATAPQASVSAVAPPAPASQATTAARVQTPRQEPARPRHPEDHSRSGKAGREQRNANKARDRALAQAPQSLGWAPAPGRKPAAAPIEPVRTSGAPQEIGIEPKVVRLELEATDLVCAVNSRGELALDLGDQVLVKFNPRMALVLTRFLAGTTVLEQIHARGEL